METFLGWLLPMLVGVLVLSAILQLLYAWALSAIVEKLDESELMQVLAWIPVLQIAPVVAAGGGSVGGFLLGMLGLILGSVALGIASSVVGGTFGALLGVVAIVGAGGLGLVYMGWLLWNTAVRRELPGWIGLLSFVPLVNLFVYPYIAFHDGWSPPHRIGVVIGLVLTVGSTAPSVQTIRTLQQSGGLTGAMAAMTAEGELSEMDPEQAAAFESMLSQALGETFESASSMTPPSHEDAVREPDRAPGEGLPTPTTASVKALFDLGERFDALTPLFAAEQLARPNGAARAREALAAARSELDTHRPLIGEQTWASLTAQLDGLSARLDGGAIAGESGRGRLMASPRGRDTAPGSTGPAAMPAFSDRNTPPRRPFPVRPAADCPTDTRLVSRTGDDGDEEWCEQDAEHGGLRHGWYVRYWPSGRPESTGEYRDGLRVGVWTRFHETGEIRAQAQFERGLQHGWLLTFDEAGERQRAVRYVEGVIAR